MAGATNKSGQMLLSVASISALAMATPANAAPTTIHSRCCWVKRLLVMKALSGSHGLAETAGRDGWSCSACATVRFIPRTGFTYSGMTQLRTRGLDVPLRGRTIAPSVVPMRDEIAMAPWSRYIDEIWRQRRKVATWEPGDQIERPSRTAWPSSSTASSSRGCHEPERIPYRVKNRRTDGTNSKPRTTTVTTMKTRPIGTDLSMRVERPGS